MNGIMPARIGVGSIDGTRMSTTSWPPSSAKAAEKIDEPTNREQTQARS
jgi:hypothetical protein